MATPLFSSTSADTSISDALTELALDLRWAYNHSADHLWERLDPELWKLTHNPWLILQTVSPAKLQTISTDPVFQALVADLCHDRRTAAQAESWFQRTHPNSVLTAVAYFSMEFMLSEALPVYSGGLGNVAGDQLKAASDLGVPVIGIGLLYQQGYFCQKIDAQGRQQALYPFNDPGQLPIKRLRDKDGEWLRLCFDLPGAKVWARTWEVQIGRARLYLLDTNDPANIPEHRSVCTELYGGGPELRLQQELLLGIGGWRLMEALGIKPEVCHLNEGHAAFAVLERARSYMAENHTSFDVALAITRAGNLFTTHTAVSAGFDSFDPSLIRLYLKKYAEERLSISVQELLALGRRDPDDSSEPFKMAYLAMRGSSAVNGVSKLHGQVSRRIFQPLFPRWPENEVPITHVTNGVHAPTWDSECSDHLWEATCGKNRWRDRTENIEQAVRKVSDSDLWQLRANNRKALVQYVRKRHYRQLAGLGASSEELAQAEQVLDAASLTLGFARRFAPYKRPNLLLYDPERLASILTSTVRPVQLVLAGKAHPADIAGQDMIQQWILFAGRPEIQHHVVFLADYDILLAEHLVQGVDLWVNTPRRPWEASGTSGMKVLVNGVLNLSELDGWWAEAYKPEFGWSIGDGLEHDGDPAWDASEASAIYHVLEQEIIPDFYNRDERGIPRAWVARMRESMSRLAPQFSTNRVVREYTERYYLSAAAAFAARNANSGQLGRGLLKWQAELAKYWSSVRFGTATVEERDHEYAFRVQVFLGDVNPEAVAVELFAEGMEGNAPACQALDVRERLAGSQNAFVYSALIPATRPATDYTPRLIPHHGGAFVPLEAPFILWHDSPSWRSATVGTPVRVG